MAQWSSLLGHSLFGITVKKTKKICDEILERFGDGEYLRHICTGKGEYPWRQRQNVACLVIRNGILLGIIVITKDVLMV